ncbi:hypothetical protein HA402_011649 [Bradysia odoriphaga]|nr:hypothetical protein HA402_011649 [Bradysia odoriphaga]
MIMAPPPPPVLTQAEDSFHEFERFLSESESSDQSTSRKKRRKRKKLDEDNVQLEKQLKLIRTLYKDIDSLSNGSLTKDLLRDITAARVNLCQKYYSKVDKN